MLEPRDEVRDALDLASRQRVETWVTEAIGPDLCESE